MAELHRRSLTAVLAADAELDIRSGLAAQFTTHLHQLTDPILIEGDERIVREEILLNIDGQEFAGIIAGKAVGGLGQVVGTEGEEFGFLGDDISSQGRAGSSIMVPIR